MKRIGYIDGRRLAFPLIPGDGITVLNVGTIAVPLTYAAAGDLAAQISTNFTLATAGGHKALHVKAKYTPTTATGVATVQALYGEVELATGKTHNEAAFGMLAGVTGYANIVGTLDGAGLWVAGVMGQVGPAAPEGLTEFQYLSCFTALNTLQTEPLAGYYAAYLIGNAGGWRYDYGFLMLETGMHGIGILPSRGAEIMWSGIVFDATHIHQMDRVIELVDTVSINNFLKSGAEGGCVIPNTHSIDAHALQHILRCDLNDGEIGYIPVFAAVPE
ncbi:hypothetical protein ES703_123135 [subsurface metagenome]